MGLWDDRQSRDWGPERYPSLGRYTWNTVEGNTILDEKESLRAIDLDRAKMPPVTQINSLLTDATYLSSDQEQRFDEALAKLADAEKLINQYRLPPPPQEGDRVSWFAQRGSGGRDWGYLIRYLNKYDALVNRDDWGEYKIAVEFLRNESL